MSCDYDVRCLDCGSNAGFDDTNHAIKEMRALAKMGAGLAVLARGILAFEKALADDPALYLEPQFKLRDLSHGWRLTPKWWAEHGDHHLVAVDEYGRCDDECAERFDCKECGYSKWCRRTSGHDGQHRDKRDDEVKR
jgi:hypothetical protein